MRIAIDLQGAQTASRFRGIGRYSMALAQGIVRNAGEHEVWLVLNGALEESVIAIRAAFDGLVPQERIRVFETPGQVAAMDRRNTARLRAGEMIREQFIALLQPDVVLVTSLFEGYTDDALTSAGCFVDATRTAVVQYDLIPLLKPESYLASPSQRQHYMHNLASLKRAGLLLSISDYAREEAIEVLGLAPEQVVPISTAVDERFAPAALAPALLAGLRQGFGITRALVMCAPGGSDPRKNLKGLVTAYSLLPAALRASHQLLIASRMSAPERSQLEAHARQAGLGPDELILTGHVSDETLIDLYRAATLFVFPSLHEGFGLPALEAMACGAVVIGSNSTSIPEVIGLEEAMFDPAQPRAIAGKIAEVLGDSALYERLRVHSRNQAQKFSWDQTARRALHALEAHCASHPPAPPRAHSALLEAITAVPNLPATEENLLQLAHCLAALPDLAAQRQLLVDAGARARAAAPGEARLENAVLLDLLRNPPPGVKVVPVLLSSQGGAWHYRHARAHEARLLGRADAPGVDRVADLCSGDVLFSLCPGHEKLGRASADGLFAHLQRLGVRMHFVVDDALASTLPMPAAAPGEPGWQDALHACADGVHCASPTAFQAWEAWRAGQPAAPRTGAVALLAPAGGLPDAGDYMARILQVTTGGAPASRS